MKRTLLLVALLCAVCCKPEQKPVGVIIPCDNGQTIRVQVVSSDILRVSAVQGSRFKDRESLVVLPSAIPGASYTTEKTDSTFAVMTEAVTLRVHTRRGTVSFLRPDGTPFFTDGEIRLTPSEVEGKAGYQTLFRYLPETTDEAFYGLGQHQTGEFNRRGTNEELYQYNTKISNPVVVSTSGYGLYFDAYSYSHWGNPEGFKPLGDVLTLIDKDGKEGALTGTYTPLEGEPVVRREENLSFENEWTIRDLPDIPLNGTKVVYEGALLAPKTGMYFFTQYYAGFQKTFFGSKEVMTGHWRPAWNPNSCRYMYFLRENMPMPIRIEWDPDGDVSYIGLRVAPFQTADEQFSFCFSSEFEPMLDFYFMAGEQYDDVIAGYRKLSGEAPLIPKWALGFWQSRERYSTQEELVGTLAELRRRHIPVDNIVQDWQYWKEDQWGSHEFDPERYPDPEKMLDDVHALHGRFMISVWPKFYTNTDHYRELKAAGYAYTHAEDSCLVDWLGHPQSFYDAYADGGRKMFWRQMDESLYSKYGRKIDAWWMDASEPNLRDCLPMDYQKWLTTPNALGSSTEYLNAYALVNAKAIYEGQRSVDPDKRVFLLTRNGFAGLQRYSTASWSGDIGTSWTDMRMQMAAGLGYSMSGLPWWGMDIVGFSVMSKFYDASHADEWQELQTRWHQFGAFVPLFRAHGQWPQRELWNIAPEGSPAYESILYYMRLRYRLMPYIYSVAASVAFEGGTMMRGLPMDYPEDPAVRRIDNQWLFGPALMPCPVTEYKARSREVYFPEGTWYDFYTGTVVAGNNAQPASVTVSAPYERIPLYVRGGSIIPVGPEIEYTDEKAADDLLLLVYAGADADFTLYEDDGTSYGYERGECSRIRIYWNDGQGVLTIGEREGSWPGMPERRLFRVRIVNARHPFAFDPDDTGAFVIRYDGTEAKRQAAAPSQGIDAKAIRKQGDHGKRTIPNRPPRPVKRESKPLK